MSQGSGFLDTNVLANLLKVPYMTHVNLILTCQSPTSQTEQEIAAPGDKARIDDSAVEGLCDVVDDGRRLGGANHGHLLLQGRRRRRSAVSSWPGVSCA